MKYCCFAVKLRYLGVVLAMVPMSASHADEPLGGALSVSGDAMVAHVEQLLAAVQAADTQSMDAAACGVIWRDVGLARAERLGLIVDATEPELLQKYEMDFHAAVMRRVNDWLARGKTLSTVDVSQLTDVTPEEAVNVPAGPPIDLLADGIITLSWETGLVTDLAVSYLDGRWCLNVAAVQPQALAAP